jgi:hypothetical protein
VKYSYSTSGGEGDPGDVLNRREASVRSEPPSGPYAPRSDLPMDNGPDVCAVPVSCPGSAIVLYDSMSTRDRSRPPPLSLPAVQVFPRGWTGLRV